LRDLHGADYFELTDLLEDVLELRAGLVKIQRYDRVNQDATQKIYAKLAQFQDAVYRSHRTEWVELQHAWRKQCFEDLRRLHRLVLDIHEARSHEEPVRSLYLQNLQDQISSTFVPSNELYHAIRYDDRPALGKLLQKNTKDNGARPSDLDTLIEGVLEFSITCHSVECAYYLISEKLPDIGIIADHNSLNHLITVTGKCQTSIVPSDLDLSEALIKRPSSPSFIKAGTSLFLRVLEYLGPRQIYVLQAKDTVGRSPLHHGARYGLLGVCQTILESLQNLDQNPSAARDAILSVDSTGRSPLQYALIHNHQTVTKFFLDRLENDFQTDNEARNQETRNVLGNLLIVALRYQHDGIVSLLASSHVDLSRQTSGGLTALYVAAQIGREDYVKTLLEITHGSDTIETPEAVRNWTPLFIACVNGHLSVVQLLLQAGASQSKLDNQGWTAKEHAAFKGHLTIAGVLDKCQAEDYGGGPANTPFLATLKSDYRNAIDRSLLVINIGPTRNGKRGAAVDLNYCSPVSGLGVCEGSELLLEISVPGSREFVQMPILEETLYKPFIFGIDDPNQTMVVFRVFHAAPYLEDEGKLVGGGTALLTCYSYGFGDRRESLIRDHTVPITDSTSSDPIGTITFTFVIVEPYRHVNTPSPSVNDPLKAEKVQLVGHRGRYIMSLLGCFVNLI
jgi:glycerophosphodiester phosphodiesterase